MMEVYLCHWPIHMVVLRYVRNFLIPYNGIKEGRKSKCQAEINLWNQTSEGIQTVGAGLHLKVYPIIGSCL